MTTETACPWLVWTYAIKPGWERSDAYSTRDEAREVRAVLIDRDGCPPELVAVRHESLGAPKRRPSQAALLLVELAAGVAGVEW